jgi:hypothetical protein
MSVEEIKKEIAVLSEEERHELSSFLANLEIQGDSDYWTRVRSRLDDQDANHWIDVKNLITNS